MKTAGSSRVTKIFRKFVNTILPKGRYLVMDECDIVLKLKGQKGAILSADSHLTELKKDEEKLRNAIALSNIRH